MARTASGLALMPHHRDFAQIEQLQRDVPAARSRSASMLTLPQWQLALCFLTAMCVLPMCTRTLTGSLAGICQEPFGAYCFAIGKSGVYSPSTSFTTTCPQITRLVSTL